jgi:hypothetical protein
MSNKHEERFSVGRWSRRKLDAARTAPADPAPTSPAPPPAPTATTAPAPVELPPVDSLTFDSDFTAFLRPEVDADLKRAALKQLFRDPRFNVMDGLDTYIDDYTKADPIPEDMLAGLMQRFASASLPDEPPPVAAAESQPAANALQPPVSAAIAGEDVPAERNASAAGVPSLASAEDAAAAQDTTEKGVVPSAGAGAEQAAGEPVPHDARNEGR